jgi:hypothetical protein
MGGRGIAHSHTADTLKTYTATHRTYLPFCRGLAAFIFGGGRRVFRFLLSRRTNNLISFLCLRRLRYVLRSVYACTPVRSVMACNVCDLGVQS